MFSWNRLARGVKALFFVQIINRAGDFVVPFLTLLLTQVQGLSPAAAGLVVALATALGGVGGLLAARLGDRGSRRDTLAAFLGISAVLVGAAGFAPAQVTTAAVLVAAGFFFGAMRPLIGALVADLSAPDTRRAAFSLSYFGVNLGVSVGPMAAAWLFHNALSWLFWLDALSTIAALGVLLVFVPRRTGHVAQPEDAPIERPLRQFLRHPVLAPFEALQVLYTLVYAQMVFTLALQLVDQFGGEGATLFGVVWAVNGLVVIAATPLALRLTRRWTNLAAMAAGMALFAAGTAVFLFHPDVVWVLVSAVLWSTGEVLFSIHVGDLIAGNSPPTVRARFQAYNGFVSTLTFAAAPALGGVVAEGLGLGAVWAGATVLVVAAGVGFAALGRAQTPWKGVRRDQ